MQNLGTFALKRNFTDSFEDPVSQWNLEIGYQGASVILNAATAATFSNMCRRFEIIDYKNCALKLKKESLLSIYFSIIVHKV